ncbi:hypothetical protein HN011_006565 [Eciton burchellii]|nr:hypothetical protein HN011_006565 [Eciton burchellii]
MLAGDAAAMCRNEEREGMIFGRSTVQRMSETNVRQSLASSFHSTILTACASIDLAMLLSDTKILAPGCSEANGPVHDSRADSRSELLNGFPER